MYGFKCVHCGQLELAHIEDLEEHIRNNFRVLPDREHAEELHLHEVDELTEHQRGYKHHLVECPGFEYPNDISIEELARRVEETPSCLEYLPDDLIEKVKVELKLMKDLPRSGSHNMAGGAATYMSFDPQTGTSYIIYAE
jgi:hypothetical protein